MLLLIPVLYVNQEMVLRLGAVTGVGHARLIFERFGKLEVLGSGTILGLIGYLFTKLVLMPRKLLARAPMREIARDASEHDGQTKQTTEISTEKASWRMPALDQLPPPELSLPSRVWMGVLRGYLVIAVGLIIYKIIDAAVGG